MHASVRDLEAESLVCARDGSLSIHVSEAISVQSCERAQSSAASMRARPTPDVDAPAQRTSPWVMSQLCLACMCPRARLMAASGRLRTIAPLRMARCVIYIMRSSQN